MPDFDIAEARRVIDSIEPHHEAEYKLYGIAEAAVAEVERLRGEVEAVTELGEWERTATIMGHGNEASASREDNGEWIANWYDVIDGKWCMEYAPTATALRAKLEGK